MKYNLIKCFNNDLEEYNELGPSDYGKEYDEIDLDIWGYDYNTEDNFKFLKKYYKPNDKIISLTIQFSTIKINKKIIRFFKKYLYDIKQITFEEVEVVGDINKLLFITKKIDWLSFCRCKNTIDLAKIYKIKELKSLSLKDAIVTNLHKIKYLKNLYFLLLSEISLMDDEIIKYVYDLNFIKHLKKLEILEINDTKISNIKFVLHLTQLKSIKLENNCIEDFNILKKLENLKSIHLGHNFNTRKVLNFTKSPRFPIDCEKVINSSCINQKRVNIVDNKLYILLRMEYGYYEIKQMIQANQTNQANRNPDQTNQMIQMNQTNQANRNPYISFGIKSIKRCDVNSVGLIAPICRNKILFKDVSYFIKVSSTFRENSRHINSEDTKNIYFKYLLSNLFLRKP